jgi:hypothetical protein
METKVTCAGCVTATAVVPDVFPSVAPIVAVPTPTLTACPVAEMLTTPGAVELQVTLCVKSWIVLSVNNPVAVNCWVAPVAKVTFPGVITIDLSVADVTRTSVEALNAPKFAVTFDVPITDVLTSPLVEIEATPGLAELHVTCDVISAVEPSE